MKEYLGPLDEVLRDCLAPVLLAEGEEVSDDLFHAGELPCRLGGLGLRRFAAQAREQYEASRLVTRPLADLILAQGVELNAYPAEEIRKLKRELTQRRDEDRIGRYSQFQASDADVETRRAIVRGAEPGASAWLAGLPIREAGLDLDRPEWEDNIALRLGQPLRHLPKFCGCGKVFTVAHGLQCATGGFVMARHNSLRDFFVALSDAIFRYVRREPRLESLSEEEKLKLEAQYKTANLAENPRGDFSIVGLFRQGERCFMDVRVWNHLACSYRDMTAEEVHTEHEQEKIHVYKDRIEYFENGRFLPVVFNTAGSASPGAQLLMNKLALQMESTGSMSFAAAKAFIVTRVSVITARSASACIRGTHKKKDRTEWERALGFAHKFSRRGGCSKGKPMHERMDVGVIEDMLRLSRVPQNEERPDDCEPCACPPGLRAEPQPPDGLDPVEGAGHPLPVAVAAASPPTAVPEETPLPPHVPLIRGRRAARWWPCRARCPTAAPLPCPELSLLGLSRPSSGPGRSRKVPQRS